MVAVQILIRIADCAKTSETLGYKVGDIVDILASGVHAGRKVLSDPNDWQSSPNDGKHAIIDCPDFASSAIRAFLTPLYSKTEVDKDGEPKIIGRNSLLLDYNQLSANKRNDLFSKANKRTTLNYSDLEKIIVVR